MNFLKEFKLLLKAKCTLIHIQTIEEDRIEHLIKSSSKDTISNRSVYVWDFIEGYKSNPIDNKFGSKNPIQALEFIEKFDPSSAAIFMLKDFHLFLNDIAVTRKLKNLYKSIKSQPKSIIITSPEPTVPDPLRDLVTTIEFRLPQPTEIKSELIRVLNSLNSELPDFSLNMLTQSCQGLTLEKIRKILSKVISTHKEINVESLGTIFAEKKEIINQTKILEFCTTTTTMSDVGGLENLKSWLQKRIGSLSDRAEIYGLPSPKGLFLVGIQGTGKSLIAKAIANEWNLPLLRLDIGKLFGGIVGESESRIRQTILLTEAMSPCILWIDEIDKGFSGTDGRGDSGTSNRVLATFITWLSEKRSPVFVVATANRIDHLPTELIRKGRFDEIFFIDLPDEEEKQSIFQVHLSRLRPKSWKKYDIKLFSQQAKYFSGSEIEEVIVDAMHNAFNENREFSSNDILKSIKEFVPLAITNQEKINQLQEWASSGRIRMASADLKK